MVRQEQDAGGESVLLQAAGDIIVSGLSASDVVEITRAEVSRAVEGLTLTARAVAEERVKGLEGKILERFAQQPHLMGAFGDPDFQYSLRDAGRATASNEDPYTEELLVDLLANRAEEGNTARVRLATSHAVRAADKLSLDALNGLTGLWAITSLAPTEEDLVAAHVQTVRDVTDALVDLPLPSDPYWIQETDALNLTRSVLSSMQSRKGYRALLQERAAKHLVHGIPEDRYQELMADSSVPELTGKVARHQLKSGFIVLVGGTREEFLEMFPSDFTPTAPLDELIALNGFGAPDPEAVGRWTELLDEVPASAAVGAWWDGTPLAEITMIGKVIGFVNARRHIAFSGATNVAELLGASA